MVELNNLIIDCIKKRQLLPEPTISLRGLLTVNGMVGYIKLCSRRISQAKLIDGEDIVIDLSDPYNLLMTSKGIDRAFDIIKGYCDEHKLSEYKNALVITSRLYNIINAQTAYYRLLSIKDLNEMKNQDLNEINIPQEYKESIVLFASEELKARKLHNILKRKIVKIANELCIWKKYRDLARSVRQAQYIDSLY